MTELMTQQPLSGTVHPVDGTAAAEPGTIRRRLPVSPTSAALALASPAVTATMLVLARHWPDHGARHSNGDMVAIGVSMILGAAITAWAAATKDAVLVGTAGSLTAAALGIGMMAYPAGMSEPLIVTAVATVTGWVFTRRQWLARGIRRQDAAERQADRDHEANVVGMQCQTAIEVTALREQGATNREKLRQLGKTKRAELRLDAAEYDALKTERDTRRRHFMTVSPTAATAMDQPGPAAADSLSATARDALDAAPRLQIEPAPAAVDDFADLAAALGVLRMTA
ncbi:hypothetical protein [Catenulispora rubra]|uniref:hypothetical protein n=1 Tax=Catenulispora rubra TaxID=280293 RepID=UPI00189217D0|nr:hypothetical protein [Catenulispora rubra]